MLYCYLFVWIVNHATHLGSTQFQNADHHLAMGLPSASADVSSWEVLRAHVASMGTLGMPMGPRGPGGSMKKYCTGNVKKTTICRTRKFHDRKRYICIMCHNILSRTKLKLHMIGLLILVTNLKCWYFVFSLVFLLFYKCVFQQLHLWVKLPTMC